MQRGVAPCGNGVPFSVSESGTCRGCSANNVSGTALRGVVAVANGASHTCALLSDGTVDCWGDSSAMQLGYSTPLHPVRRIPLPVPGLTRRRRHPPQWGLHTCALLGDGSVWCWGGNASGELGSTSSRASSTPQAVAGLAPAVAVAAGATNTCALLVDGTVACWGDDTFGELGEGAGGATSSSPVVVEGISGAVSIDVGDSHACAVLSDGTVACWGNDASGQLGDGATGSSAAPVAIVGVSGATAVAAGDAHSCAPLLADGTGRLHWGLGTVGQLGNGAAAGSFTAAPVGGVVGVVSVSAGTRQSCATLSSGAVTCWGANTGAFTDPLAGAPLGDFGMSEPTAAAGPRPAGAFGIAQATGASVGQGNACAVSSDGTVLCWGQNAHGELGTGDLTPVLFHPHARQDGRGPSI